MSTSANSTTLAMLFSCTTLDFSTPSIDSGNAVNSKMLADAQRASKNYQGAIESYLQFIFYKDSVYSFEEAQKINAQDFMP